MTKANVYTIDKFLDEMWEALNTIPIAEWNKLFDERSKLIRPS